MRAELLSVGTELLLGEIVDSNSAWLAQELARRGVDVLWSQRVGDNFERLQQAVSQALSRSRLLIMCGGLGPTDDDMTREAVAAFLGEKPQVEPGLEADLRAKFASFGRSMPERNLKQAWLIPSATSLANPIGTAPGWLVRFERNGAEKIIVTLPGPPRELERMWLHEAVPKLDLPASALFMHTFKTYGIGESAVAEHLDDLTRQANPSVATYAKRDGVHVRVAVKADGMPRAEALAAPVLNRIAETLGRYVWGTGEDELAEVVMKELARQDSSVASMEAISGGLIAANLSAVSEASRHYKGGVVAYSQAAKTLFGVPETLLSEYGNVSAEAALAMAEAVREHLDSDWGLATTGVSQSESQHAAEVGTVYVAAVSAGRREQKTLRLPPTSRTALRERSCYSALFWLWRQLEQA